MIVKKKLKSNRGRPRKEFKPKHKRLQEQAKSDTPALIEHMVPKRERILRIPSKDKSIFYLFIFSIVLFLCSLLISFLRKDNIQELEKIQGEISVDTGASTITEGTIIDDTPLSVAQVIEHMYLAISSKSFDELSNYWDNSLKNTSTIRTYFNEKWLTRFIDNTDNKNFGVGDSKVEELNDYSRKVTYTLLYVLSGGQQFTENRVATVIKRDDTYKIATIKCETTGCSRMPFFNPGKYGIK